MFFLLLLFSCLSTKQWCSKAFKNVNVVPPDVGTVHQVNLEYLSRVIQVTDDFIYPDSVVGTDSHTTMINGLGILGWGKTFFLNFRVLTCFWHVCWQLCQPGKLIKCCVCPHFTPTGVGGIETEAVMLGQPVSLTLPQVVGCKLVGSINPLTTSIDIVLGITKVTTLCSKDFIHTHKIDYGIYKFLVTTVRKWNRDFPIGIIKKKLDKHKFITAGIETEMKESINAAQKSMYNASLY